MVPRTYVIEEFIREEIVQVCYEKKKKKKRQSIMLQGKVIIIDLIACYIKKTSLYSMRFFQKLGVIVKTKKLC